MARTYIDSDGYRRFSDSDMLVSHWSAQNRIGRPLRDGEVVHHINRNKLDNKESNLYVFKNQQYHDEAHEEDDWY